MQKQLRQLIVLLLALVALTAVFLGLRQFNRTQDDVEEEKTGETIVDVAEDDILRFTYDCEGETYVFEKESDTWYYAEDHSLSITQYKIRNMLSMLAPLKAKQVIENVTDMAQYGLAEPSRTINYETEGASYIFYVGDYNSVTDVHYIRRPSENTVYAVSSGTVTIFNKSLEDLVEEEMD